METKIEHIVISPGHNFVGHYGKPPGTNPVVHKESVKLLPGFGIEGDRYSQREEGHKSQITFFDLATIDALSEFTGKTIPPETVRRNVFVRGIDLPSLVGKTFSVQGVQFHGMDPCPPCEWMDKMMGDGARELMEGRGGLRAKILTDGNLSVGPFDLEILSEDNGG